MEGEEGSQLINKALLKVLGFVKSNYWNRSENSSENGSQPLKNVPYLKLIHKQTNTQFLAGAGAGAIMAKTETCGKLRQYYLFVF